MSQTDWPVAFEEVLDAARRLRPYLMTTPLRRYATLDDAVGAAVWVKHENMQPTNSFKVRNGLSAATALAPEARRRGLIAATRGNHGLGLAYAGQLLDAPVVICVPRGNNPEKNAAMRGLGAEVVEEGADYDAAVEVATRLQRERGLELVHSTNHRQVIAGAATLTLEILQEEPRLDALVIAVGGGSQAVGALTVARVLRPQLEVFAVQAERADAMHASWVAGTPQTRASADTIADGLATRNAYPMTFAALRAGLRDFFTVSERELAAAVRLVMSTTHQLAEPAGAAGLAGLVKERARFAGRRVGVVLSGGNIDDSTLRRVLGGDLA